MGPDARCAQAARRYVVHALEDQGWPQERCDIAGLVTSEILTNAIRHAAGPPAVTVALMDDHVRVTVEDHSPAAVPVMQGGVSWSDGGRGLRIVDALATGWGFATADSVKQVWFELDL